MKVLWLAPYPISSIEESIKKTRDLPKGTGMWLINLLEELIEIKDLKLFVLTKSPYLQNDFEIVTRNNVSFYIIKDSFIYQKGYPYYFPFDVLTKYSKFIKYAKKIIDDIKPDIVHSHGTEGPYALLGTKLKYPHIISIQGIIGEYYKISPSIRYFFQKKIEKDCIKESKYFVCRTNWDKAFVRSLNKEAKIFNINEAINPVFFQHTWKPINNRTILFVGSINKNKGIEVLINSIIDVKKEFPNIKLKIVGRGEPKYIAFLKSIVIKKNIEENIDWLGTKNSNEIAKLLMDSYLFVLPTYLDNSPNSLAEAMAVGTPSIVTSVGGVPSMVNDGINGFLIEKSNPVSLSNKIKTLISLPGLCKKISDASQNKAIERNLSKNVAKTTYETYRRIINE